MIDNKLIILRPTAGYSLEPVVSLQWAKKLTKGQITMAKRRPQGDGMVRKRSDGRWEARIIVNPSGKLSICFFFWIEITLRLLDFTLFYFLVLTNTFFCDRIKLTREKEGSSCLPCA